MDDHCPASHRWRWKIRLEQRTGILFGTFHVSNHWSRWSPIYIGPVGCTSLDWPDGYWQRWAKASGVSVSTFRHAAYVTVSHFDHSDDWNRQAFRLSVAAIALVVAGVIALN